MGKYKKWKKFVKTKCTGILKLHMLANCAILNLSHFTEWKLRKFILTGKKNSWKQCNFVQKCVNLTEFLRKNGESKFLQFDWTNWKIFRQINAKTDSVKNASVSRNFLLSWKLPTWFFHQIIGYHSDFTWNQFRRM